VRETEALVRRVRDLLDAAGWTVISTTILGILGLLSIINALLADGVFFMFSFYLFRTRDTGAQGLAETSDANKIRFAPHQLVIVMALILAAGASVAGGAAPVKPVPIAPVPLDQAASGSDSRRICPPR